MKWPVILRTAVCLGLTACSAEQRAQMEAEKLESFDLTVDQRTIADALLVGYKAETGLSMLRSRDYARAACYAKSVDMPRRYARAHLLYLENYDEADEDFYPFFQRQGIDENAAWEMSEKFRVAYEKCSLR